MTVHITIEAMCTVEAESVDDAMDLIESGKIRVNPYVLLRCQEKGIGRLSLINSIKFRDENETE